MQDRVASEQEFNRRWQLQPGFTGRALHDDLLANEFDQEDLIRARSDALARRVLRHAIRAVPYYRDQWRRLGVWRSDLENLDSLSALPVLDKAVLLENFEALTADYPRSGQREGGDTRTAGTTGQPTRVLHSMESQAMFSWLKQRELRWFRVDPEQRLLSIRPSVDFPRLQNGKYLEDGRVLKSGRWPYLGSLFRTGPAWAFNATNPVHDQADVLHSIKPGLLVMQASCLENLSVQNISQDAVTALRGALAISQTLTPAMQEQIEAAFKAPIYQNYGLNEIGLVASRCREGGRYHVHTEHCHVELLREDGSPARPGEYGRLVVTALQNSVMPLIRYDTGDQARVLTGTCACGRKLPSFGDVLGRYRRLAYLPEGSYQRFSDIHLALYEFAEQRRSVLRKFQVYEYRTGNFEVRIDCAPGRFGELAALVRRAYLRAWPRNPAPPLEVIETTDFHGHGLTKFQIFLSEFFPEADLPPP